MQASIVSVNVGAAAELRLAGGKPYTSAIGKSPVEGRVAVRGVNVDGDDQADRNVHGGPDRVAYAYGADDYAWWSSQLGRTLAPGLFGENLTVAGIDPQSAVVGERWTIGTDGLVLEVSKPRVPCYKLAATMNDPHFVKRFSEARRPGTYLRVLAEGTVGAGDSIAVSDRPAHGITIGEVNRIFLFDREEMATLLAAPQLGEEWIAYIHEQIERRH